MVDTIRILILEDVPTDAVIVEKNEGIDLLLTDVVLTGAMNGPDVAETCRNSTRL